MINEIMKLCRIINCEIAFKEVAENAIKITLIRETEMVSDVMSKEAFELAMNDEALMGYLLGGIAAKFNK